MHNPPESKEGHHEYQGLQKLVWDILELELVKGLQSLLWQPAVDRNSDLSQPSLN